MSVGDLMQIVGVLWFLTVSPLLTMLLVTSANYSDSAGAMVGVMFLWLWFGLAAPVALIAGGAA